jgi:signal transduction histidine kinase/CheY-like chemotaxis protein
MLDPVVDTAGADGVDGLAFWRRRIVSAILSGLAALGLLAYVPSLVAAVAAEYWAIAVLDTVVYAWILLLLFARRMGDTSRATQLVVLLYALGIALIGLLGPHGAGLLWLGAASTLTAVLLGTRAAIAALVTNAVVLTSAGVAIAWDAVPWAHAVPTPLVLWVVLSANSLLVEAVVALSVGALLGGLEASIARERVVAAQLRQSQKLEAIGTLAGGIAHELNNMLAPILAESEALRAALPPDAPAQRELGRIAGAAGRARDLVRRILVFGRRDRIERRVRDLGKAVREASALLQATIPPRIELVVDTGPEGLPVLAGDSEVQQIVMNLAGNAVQAMAAAGTLTIRVTSAPERNAVRILVGDTGKGMDAATVEHAFEPFFTTKRPGEGTGLGLSTVHGIARALGGNVEIDSAPGHGTRVTVELPIAAAGLAAETESSDAVGIPALTVGGVALLVDDDPTVLEAHAHMLERLGYRVTRARSGEEALALLRGGFAPTVLVTDLAMPGMGGLDLLARAREHAALLPIVLATGFLDPEDEARIAAMAGVAVILKPFGMREIAEVLAGLRARAS